MNSGSVPYEMSPQLSVPVSQVRLPKGGVYTNVFDYHEADIVAAMMISGCKGSDCWRGFTAMVLIVRAKELQARGVSVFAGNVEDLVATGILALRSGGMLVGLGRRGRVLYPTEALLARLRRHGYVD